MLDIWLQRQLPRADIRDGDHRNAAQRDKARVLHSAAFRRLQAKTQIHGIGQSDFYRTRLTHSLEAAQIGTGITEQLRKKFPEESQYLALDGFLIDAICLAHDLGHPPFGHGGEVALNYMMREHGGFEGNAQTFRIATKLEPYTQKNGMNLSRRTILGLIKYPQFIDQLASPYPHCEAKSIREIQANRYHPPKGLYTEDQDNLAWVLQPLSENDKKLFMTTDMRPGKHAKTRYKSVDCSIMELADDIAYGIHDLEDAIVMQKVNLTTFVDEVVKPIQKNSKHRLADRINFLSEELFADESYRRKNAIGVLVNNFITSIDLVKLSVFDNALLDYQAQMPSLELACLQMFKDYVRRNVINTTEVQIHEYRGQQLIIELFQAFASEPERLLPHKTYQHWLNADKHANGLRVIADYISSMTDEYAQRLHSAMFSGQANVSLML